MRICMPSTILAAVLLTVTNNSILLCEARKSSNSGRNSMPPPSSRRRPPSNTSRRSSAATSRSSSSTTRRKAPVVVDEYDDVTDDEDHFGLSDDRSDDEEDDEQQEMDDDYDDDEEMDDDYDDEEDDYDDYEQQRGIQRRRMPQSQSRPTARLYKPTSKPIKRLARSNPSRSRPSPLPTRLSKSSRSSPRQSSSRSSSRSRRVVPYTRSYRPPPSAFSRGLTALKSSIPDPQTLKSTTLASLSSARQASTQLSSNLYREVKGLRSSELEQVFLKATKPDDTPAKSGYVDQLVMGTYHMTGVPDPWDFALRKLWSKMIESDWRTTLKAVYVLHRFGVDGAEEQRGALKGKLKKMRRSVDVKRKGKYFNSKMLLGGAVSPANKAYRAFLARYAHYVLLRVRCFGGLFTEIAELPPTPPSKKRNNSRSSKSSRNSSQSSSSQQSQQQKQPPITTTRLKKEHLDAAKLVLKAGVTCKLKPSEECENTAIAMETVVADMIGLTAAVAKALNSVLKSTSPYEEEEGSIDKALIQQWCEFYAQDLLPQTKAMMKSTTPTLDAYGIFLPSRIGTTVSQELLQKGLKYGMAPVVVGTTEASTTDAMKDETTTGNQEGGDGLENDGGGGDGEEEGIDVADEGEEGREEDDDVRYGDDAAAASGEEQDDEVSRVKRRRDDAEDDYGDAAADEYDEYEYDDDDDEYYDEEYD